MLFYTRWKVTRWQPMHIGAWRRAPAVLFCRLRKIGRKGFWILDFGLRIKFVEIV
jgi:hypothetical protein